MISRSQIDKLGNRLRRALIDKGDLITLNDFRLQFGPAYRAVTVALLGLGLSPSGRPAKSTNAIRQKLLRESIRLSQVQDIAGCRVVVDNIANQNATVAKIQRLFAKQTTADRREKPTFGYRAVHIVVTIDGLAVEVQIRTSMQHLWAEVSEKLADQLPEIKYGGGPKSVVDVLQSASAIGARLETDASDEEIESMVSLLQSSGVELPEAQAEELAAVRNRRKGNIANYVAVMHSISSIDARRLP